MDCVVASSARLLAAGDPLGALKRVALRNDPPALALRGIAMAQLGDYERARKLLRSAARAFGARERLSAARCQVAEAEVALAARDLTSRMSALATAAQILDAFGDRANAIHARLVITRRHLLVGDLKAAERTLAAIDVSAATVPPPLVVRAELTRAELALRRIQATAAAAALDRAHTAAVAAGVPALVAEVRGVQRVLSAPSARVISAGVVRPARLEEVEALLATDDLIVDGCRRTVSRRARTVVLAQRPVLFVARFPDELALSCWRSVLSCLSWPRRSRRPGQPTLPGPVSLKRHSKPAFPTNRTEPGSGSRSAACAPRCACSRGSRQRHVASSSSR
jgi:hypothetical protein